MKQQNKSPAFPFAGRRRLLGAGVAALLGLGAVEQAQAQGAFPSRPIKIIVPYSAGTGSDALARTVGQSITEKTGATVIIENKEGGGSLIGTRAAANAAPDGYTILIAANPLVIVPSQSSRPQYDPVKDFMPIAKVGVIPLVLAVSPALNINSVKELVTYAKANPNKLSYGSSGPGTISQQEMELFKQAVGVDIAEIPYKSTAQAMTDLIGGTLPLFPVVVPLVEAHLKTGRAKAIAVFDSHRAPSLPNVPALSEEVSVAGYAPTPVWYGFVGPAKTPRDVVAALGAMIQNAMQTPEVKARLVVLGAQQISVGAEQFAADIKTEYDKAGLLAKKLGTYK
ncbi:MAG: tripartite tricarboxylate transporter substrate binding protein [Ramlibacter sp.]